MAAAVWGAPLCEPHDTHTFDKQARVSTSLHHCMCPRKGVTSLSPAPQMIAVWQSQLLHCSPSEEPGGDTAPLCTK